MSRVMLLVFALVALALPPLRAQDGQDGAAPSDEARAAALVEVEDLLRRRAELRRRLGELRTQGHESELAFRARLAERRREATELRRQADAAERSARALAAELAARRASPPALETARARAEEIVAALRTRVAAGIDHLVAERERTLERVAARLRATELAGVDAFSALASFFESEGRLLGSVEITNRPIDLPDGRRVHAFVLRLGTVGAVLVSEDGDVVGVDRRRAGGGIAVDLDETSRDRIAAAVRAARGRGAADVFALPVWFEAER